MRRNYIKKTWIKEKKLTKMLRMIRAIQKKREERGVYGFEE